MADGEAKRRLRSSHAPSSDNHDTMQNTTNIAFARHRVRQRRRTSRCTVAAAAAPLTLLACGWTAFQGAWGAEAFVGYSSWASSTSRRGQHKSGAGARATSLGARQSGWGRRERRPPHRVPGEHLDGSARRDGSRRLVAGATLEDKQEGGSSGAPSSTPSTSSSSSSSVSEKSEFISTVWEDDADAINNGVYTVVNNGIFGGAAADSLQQAATAAAATVTESAGVNGSVVEEQEDGEGDEDSQEDEEEGVVGGINGVEGGDARGAYSSKKGKTMKADKVNGVRFLVAPLTKSQAAEASLLPAVYAIKALKGNRGGQEESWRDIVTMMTEIKEEHGAEGLGLTYVYQVAMQAMSDMGQSEEALKLFNELKTYPESPPNKKCYHFAIVAHCVLGQRGEALAVWEEMKMAGYGATGQTYLQLMRAIRREKGALAHAEQLMARHLEERGTSVRPIFLPLCQTYMLVLGDNGLWQKAIDYFWNLVSKKNPMPDTACYDAALMACRRQGRWKEAIDLFRHIRRPEGRAQASETTYLLTMMTLLTENTETDTPVRAAQRIFQEMRDLGIFASMRPANQVSIMRGLFNECVRWEQHWPMAIDLFEMYKKHGIQPKAREIRSMLHMLSKSKDQEKGDRWEASLALLRDAQETELRLTEVSYNTVIADLGHAGKVDLAFQVFDDLQMADITPSINSYNRLLGVCEKNAEVDRTFRILDEMYKKNLPPTVVSFGSAISCCGKGMEWQKALALLVRMQHDQVQPNLQCMNAAINALALAGEWKRAEVIMQMITSAGLEPDVYSYNSLAMAYVTGGEPSQALQVLDTMRENAVDPDVVTYGTMLTACEGEDAFSTMRRLFDEMDAFGIERTAIHFGAAIEAANRERDTHMSWHLWRLMKVQGVQPNNHTFSSMITSAAIERDIGRALRLLKRMEKEGMVIDVVTYTTAVCACGPDWVLAFDVLDDMIAAGVAPNLLTWTAAMGSCMAGEEPRQAIAVFNRMREAGIMPDLPCARLAQEAYEKAGDPRGAEKIAIEIQMNNITPDWEPAWRDD